MSGERTPATRSSLLRLRRRLSQVEKGAELLRRKRESLVAQLFARARPAVDSRRAIEERASLAHRAVLDALAHHGAAELAPLGWPARALFVELVPLQLWGLVAHDLPAPPSLARTLPARGVLPGEGEAAAVTAAEEVERLLELLLAAAPKELLMRRLGHALARTTRLVNTLEQVVQAGLQGELARVRRTLEEREREEQLRLKRIVARRRRRAAPGE